MDGNEKKWVGKVLRFAVTGALLVAPLACGGSSEEEHVNEPTGQGTGGGETGGTTPDDNGTVNEPPNVNEPPDPPNVNEPAPSE